MSAKHKLNQVHVLGSLLVASLIGGMTGSWPVFWIVLGVLVIAAIYVGDIRQ